MIPVRVKLTTFIIKINGYWILPAVSERREAERLKVSESPIVKESIVIVPVRYFVVFCDNHRRTRNVAFPREFFNFC